MKSELFIHSRAPLVSRYSRLLILSAFVALASSDWTARAAIIYRETFGSATTGSGQNSTAQYDWAVHTGTGTNKSASVDTIAAINHSANASKPGGVVSVNPMI